MTSARGSRFSERVVLGSSPPADVEEHLLRYRLAAESVTGLDVLDAACGSGYGTRILGEAGARHVVGIDLSDEAVAIARERYAIPRVEFVRANLCRPFGRADFDFVVSFETIEHVTEPDAFVRNLALALRRNGRLLISSPIRRDGRPRTSPANPFHLQEWTPDEFRRLLAPHFEEVLLLGQRWMPRKRWFPGSRSLARAALRWSGFDDDRLAVIRPLPWREVPGAWVEPWPRYVLAACFGLRTSPVKESGVVQARTSKQYQGQ